MQAIRSSLNSQLKQWEKNAGVIQSSYFTLQHFQVVSDTFQTFLNTLSSATYNVKISAVRSLADICFLHVLIRLIMCVIVSVCVQVFKGC